MGCAFGNQACRQGLDGAFFSGFRCCWRNWRSPMATGVFASASTNWRKWILLISDDFGLAALNAVGRNDLLEVIEQRSGHRSTLITSQLPVDRWHDYLSGGNPTVADAILDRLISGSQRIELKGESMRKLRGHADPPWPDPDAYSSFRDPPGWRVLFGIGGGFGIEIGGRQSVVIDGGIPVGMLGGLEVEYALRQLP